VFGTDLSGGGGIEAIISARATQADQASQLLADVKQAGKLGLSKSLIRQLQAQGTSGAAALHAIVTGSPDRIALLNSLDRQTNASLAAAGIRAGNQVRGGSIADDIRRAQKQEHTLELLERRLRELAQHMKKDQTITVEIDGEAVITSIVKRNKRKGVKTRGRLMGNLPTLKVLLDNAAGTGLFPFDITPYVMAVDGYQLNRGRDDWQSAVTAGELT
jgi:hypothetical protein